MTSDNRTGIVRSGSRRSQYYQAVLRDNPKTCAANQRLADGSDFVRLLRFQIREADRFINLLEETQPTASHDTPEPMQRCWFYSATSILIGTRPQGCAFGGTGNSPVAGSAHLATNHPLLTF